MPFRHQFNQVSEGWKMVLFGEVKDHELVKKLAIILKKRGVTIESPFLPETGMYQLYVIREEDFKIARDAYETLLGIPKTYELPEAYKMLSTIKMGEVTKLLILTSIVFFLGSLLSTNKDFYSFLYISNRPYPLFEEILNGEIWRIWTPIFIHGGILHILFNLLWLKDLGKVVELYLGWKFFLVFILLTAGLSNLGQYLIAGPKFGGMSGLVYGLLGFIWALKALKPSIPFSLPKSDVVMMIIWFFLCLFGLIGNIANMAHALGLSLGILGALIVVLRIDHKIDWKKGFFFFLSSLFFPAATYFAELIKILLNSH